MTITIPQDLGLSHLPYQDINPLRKWFEPQYVPGMTCQMVSGNRDYEVRDNVVFRKSDMALMLVVPGSREWFEVPSFITKIISGAFDYCRIRELVIPATVTGSLPAVRCSPQRVIVRGDISLIDVFALHNCLTLETLILPDHPLRIGECALAGCANLTQLVLPSYLNLTVVGTREYLTMPLYSRPRAFSGCDRLRTITAGAITETWDPDTATLTITGRGTCYGSVFLTHLFVAPRKIVIGGDISEVSFGPGYLEFRGTRASRCGQADVLNEVVFGPSVRNIRGGTFSECKQLSRVSFPEGLREIGDQAFLNCTRLTVPEIPFVKTGKSAFLGCRNTPFSLSDYENTIFHGQTRVFVNSRSGNFHADYLSALGQLERFCKGVVYNGMFRQGKDFVSCGLSYRGSTSHDGTEYDVSRHIQVRRVSEAEYSRFRQEQSPVPAEAVPGLYQGMYRFVREQASETFLGKATEDSEAAEIQVYAKEFLGLWGYFTITASCRDTR